jgi:hypothetical protein
MLLAKKKKISLKKAVEELTAIAEEHLSQYPEEERDARVAAFSRAKITSGQRDSGSKASWSSRMRASRAAARGR